VESGEGTSRVFHHPCEGEESQTNSSLTSVGYCWICTWYNCIGVYLNINNNKKKNMDTKFDADGDSVCISHPPAGAGTALLGKEAAMACTVAVEEVIGDHYNRYTLLIVVKPLS